jgi:hypothetical protein
MKISTKPRELKSLRFGRKYMENAVPTSKYYSSRQMSVWSAVRQNFPRETFFHKRNRANPHHCKWKYISLWYFPYTSVLKHVSVMLTKVVIYRPLIIYYAISVENKRYVFRNHYWGILKIFIHVGIDDLYIIEQETFIKSDLYIYCILYENKRLLCKLCKHIDKWIVEVLIYTYVFIDSTHAMEYVFWELSFVRSYQNLVLSDSTCSAHFYAFYNM